MIEINYKGIDLVAVKKDEDNDPVTGTPVDKLVFTWGSFYGQGKSQEGRWYQLLPFHVNQDDENYEELKKQIDLINEGYYITRKSDE